MPSKVVGFFIGYEINIAFPIFVVNRRSDKNIEKPILFFIYGLIDKRKPIINNLYIWIFVNIV